LILILSMLSFGAASWWTNPALSGSTILYHIVILMLHGRDKPKQPDGKFDSVPPGPQHHRYPTSKTASLVFAYILASLWVIPIGFITAFNFGHAYNLSAANPRSVRAELAFVVLECGIMLAVAAVSTRMRVVTNQRVNHSAYVMAFFIHVDWRR
jgi:uncharacterized membrane protein YjjP (DUF1212 family)